MALRKTRDVYFERWLTFHQEREKVVTVFDRVSVRRQADYPSADQPELPAPGFGREMAGRGKRLAHQGSSPR